MREITFHEVGMENFGPYIEPMILTFENNKLTLITGPNGIGKTISLEAIPFTLYGETCKKAKGDDVVNTRVGRNCHTWVKFSINADDYIVDRYHKYTKLQNTVTIRKNGEEPYKKGHREALPEIERLICSKQSFTNTLMFGQKVKDFFTDLVDSDKKEIFRKILDLDIYTNWYKEADNDLKEIQAKLQSLLEQIGIDKGILGDIETQIDILFKQMNQFEETKKERVTNAKKALEDNQRLMEQWQNSRKELEGKPSDVQGLQSQINDVEQQISHHENELNNNILKLTSSRDAKISEIRLAANTALQTAVKKHRDTYDILLERHDAIIKELADEESEARQVMTDNRAKISQYETEMRICQKTINDLNNSLEIEDGVCPTCLRDIDDECRDHLVKERGNEVNRYHEFEHEQKKIEKSQETCQVLLNQIAESQSKQSEQFVSAKKELQREEKQSEQEIQERVNETIEKINTLAGNEANKIKLDYSEYIKNLREKLNGLKATEEEVSATAKKLKEIDSTLAGLENERIRFERDIKLAEEEKYDKTQLASYQMRKKELKKSIKEMGDGTKELQKDQELSEFWKKAWSPTGIPSMLIDESIPFMNEKVSEYLERLTNGRYLVSFDTLAATKKGEFRDKISVNVLDTHTRANSRIQLSGGQTRIVDIATILTLGDLQSNIQDVKINILLFDEIFDSLDEENIGFVSNILSQLKIGKSIYLISHTQVDQLEADEVLELK